MKLSYLESLALSCTLASNFFCCKLVHSSCSKLSKILYFPRQGLNAAERIKLGPQFHDAELTMEFLHIFPFRRFLSVSVRAERERAALANPENPEEAAVGFVGEIDEFSV